MAEQVTTSEELLGTYQHMSETRRFFRVFFKRGLVVFGIVILFLFLITSIFGPLFAPYNPIKQNLSLILAQPSSQHWLGTDFLGRDMLSRLIWGARMSLMVGVVATGISTVIGVIAGMLAGYYGSWVDSVIMRIMDALMSFPMMLLALLLAGLLGGGLKNVMIALGIAMLPGYARLMCGQVLSLRENDYVLAGRSMGSSNWRVMFRHILPNSFAPLIILMTMAIGGAILAEAGLSYLGIGITPPTASWGSMVNEGFKYLLTNPLLSFIPGFAVMLVVFAFNMVGDGLRDALDPRLRGTL
jgi:peptide/nickel transport system permease protein